MNFRAILLSLVVLLPAAASAQSVFMGAPDVRRSVTIGLTLRYYYNVPEAAAPVTVIAGTRVTFTAGSGADEVEWFKDGRKLPNTGTTLLIGSAGATDAGLYAAKVRPTIGPAYDTEAAGLLVTTEGPNLRNTSTRATLGPSQRHILHGFVVEPSPSPMLLLIRAVGPALAAFGVADPLAEPSLRVLDARGNVMPERGSFRLVGILPEREEATRQVGAFALPAGGKDVSRLYYLPAGAYTAELTSADGGTGTALLELYSVPLASGWGW